jgi:hypothetical protein
MNATVFYFESSTAQESTEIGRGLRRRDADLDRAIGLWIPLYHFLRRTALHALAPGQRLEAPGAESSSFSESVSTLRASRSKLD